MSYLRSCDARFFLLKLNHMHMMALFKLRKRKHELRKKSVMDANPRWNGPLFFWVLHRKPISHFCKHIAYDSVLLFTDSCPICLEALENPRTLKCKHVFCTKCLKKALAVNYKCPVCYEPQGVVHGNQPPGEMKTRFDQSQGVPGYEGVYMLYPFNFLTFFLFLLYTCFALNLSHCVDLPIKYSLDLVT